MEKNDLKRKPTQKFNCLKESNYLFLPESWWRFLWDLIILGFAVYLGIIIPFILAFEMYEIYPDVLDRIILCSFLVDIFINLNTVCYIKGHPRYERKVIIKKYIKFWFWVDFVSGMPIDLIIEKSFDSIKALKTLQIIKITKIFKLFKLFKLSKFKQTISKIEDRISSKILISIISILKFQLYLFFIAHSIGCGMFYVSKENFYPESFLNCILNKSEDKTVLELYQTTVYWSYTTMISIGYGDIAPITTQERTFAIFCMILSSVTFGVIIGYVFSMLEKNTESESERREIKTATKFYLNENKIPSLLSNKVKMFLNYKMEESKNEDVDLYDLLEILSEPLQNQIFIFLYGNILRELKVFRMFPGVFCNKISKLMQPMIYAPDDDILIENLHPVGIFYLQSGAVEFYEKKSKMRLNLMTGKGYFGEIGLFTRKAICASVRSEGYTEVLFLSISNFDSVIEVVPDAKSLFEEIQNNCEKDLRILGVECFICKRLGHFAKQCTFIDKIREKNKAVWIANSVNSKNIKMDKSLERRRKVKRFNSLNFRMKKSAKVAVAAEKWKMRRDEGNINKSEKIMKIGDFPSTNLENIFDEDDLDCIDLTMLDIIDK